MNIVVLQKLVPDTVEELAVAADQKSLDTGSLRYRVSDPDAHALEQALLNRNPILLTSSKRIVRAAETNSNDRNSNLDTSAS